MTHGSMTSLPGVADRPARWRASPSRGKYVVRSLPSPFPMTDDATGRPGNRAGGSPWLSVS